MKLTIINPIGTGEKPSAFLEDDDDTMFAPVTEQDIVDMDKKRPYRQRVERLRAARTPAPKSSDVGIETMLRTYVKDELALGELLNRFRFLCRELARAKTDLGTAMRGAVRLEREIAIFQAYKKGETLTEIGRQFGLQPDHVYLIVNQQKAAFGEPITRRDGSKFPYAAEIDKRRVDEKEAEAEAERKAELDEVPTLTDEQLEILTREFAPDPVKYRTAEDF